MKLRAVSRISVIALVIIVSAVIVIHGKLASSHPSLVGADLGATIAPGFSLVDQAGATISLAGLRGYPVALTFLDSRCSGDCPPTAQKLRDAVAALGPRAANVRWVAVSVDPAGDTAQSAAAFVASYQLTGNLHYLLGSASQLAPVWKAYGVTVPASSGASPGQDAVAHGLGVYVIDSEGRERVYLDSAFAPTTLASDLRTLLA